MSELTKFDRMLHYIIWRCKGKDNVGTKVLCKLCYFADFDHYEKHYESVTGREYIKLDHGPVPFDYDGSLETLVSHGCIAVIERRYHGYAQKGYDPILDPDMTGFSEEEVSDIDDSLSRYDGMDGKQIEDASHADMPWRCAKNIRDTLDYNMAMYRDERTSVVPFVPDTDGE
ncbi:MAG: SocA family protein [Candidatus Methanoplasma sp.]|jgi:hypothetical protein|nr:SocA family protein [Candidatus Methanoplasma sp.]